MAKIYLVDSENVGSSWSQLLPSLSGEDKMYVFYTDKSPYISYENLLQVIAYCNIPVFIKCHEGKNALDFQLVSELGFKLCQNPDAEFFIVSDDYGYDAAVKYWSGRKYNVHRMNKKLCRPMPAKKHEEAATAHAEAPLQQEAATAHAEAPLQQGAAVAHAEASLQQEAAIAYAETPLQQEAATAYAEASLQQETVAERVQEAVTQVREPVVQDAAAAYVDMISRKDSVTEHMTDPVQETEPAPEQNHPQQEHLPQDNQTRKQTRDRRRRHRKEAVKEPAAQNQTEQNPETQKSAEPPEQNAEERNAAEETMQHQKEQKSAQPQEIPTQTAAVTEPQPEDAQPDAELKAAEHSRETSPQPAQKERRRRNAGRRQKAEKPAAEGETQQTVQSAVSAEKEQAAQSEVAPAEMKQTAQSEAASAEKEQTTQSEAAPAEMEQTAQSEAASAEKEQTAQSEAAPAEMKRAAQSEATPAEKPESAAEIQEDQVSEEKDRLENAVSDADASLLQQILTMVQKWESPQPEKDAKCVLEMFRTLSMSNLTVVNTALTVLTGIELGNNIYRELKEHQECRAQLDSLYMDSQKDRFMHYVQIVLDRSELKEITAEEIGKFLLRIPRKNLNSIRSNMLKEFGHEKGAEIYSVYKPHIKVLNKI